MSYKVNKFKLRNILKRDPVTPQVNTQLINSLGKGVDIFQKKKNLIQQQLQEGIESFHDANDGSDASEDFYVELGNFSYLINEQQQIQSLLIQINLQKQTISEMNKSSNNIYSFYYQTLAQMGEMSTFSRQLLKQAKKLIQNGFK